MTELNREATDAAPPTAEVNYPPAALRAAYEHGQRDADARITELEAQLERIKSAEPLNKPNNLDAANSHIAALEAQLAKANARLKYHDDNFIRLTGERATAIRRAEAAEARLAEANTKLNAHRRFHGKSGCPGGEHCYVCSVDENGAWPEDADKWQAFPRLAQATTEARLRTEAAEARAEKLRAALETIRDWPFDVMGDCVADARKLAQLALAPDAQPPTEPPQNFPWEAGDKLRDASERRGEEGRSE